MTTAAIWNAVCIVSGIGVTLLAAGCSDLQWSRQGGSAAALESDLGECQAKARFEASPLARPYGPDLRLVGVDPSGRPIMPYYTRLDAERFLLEHDYTRACMRSRGYELVPAGQPAKN